MRLGWIIILFAALSLFGCLDVFKKKCSDAECVRQAINNSCQEVVFERHDTFDVEKGSVVKIDENTCRAYSTTYDTKGNPKYSNVCDFPIPYTSNPVCESTVYD